MSANINPTRRNIKKSQSNNMNMMLDNFSITLQVTGLGLHRIIKVIVIFFTLDGVKIRKINK